jgi:hypothetical protein
MSTLEAGIANISQIIQFVNSSNKKTFKLISPTTLDVIAEGRCRPGKQPLGSVVANFYSFLSRGG